MLGTDKVRVVRNVLLVDDIPSMADATRERFTRPLFRFMTASPIRQRL